MDRDEQGRTYNIFQGRGGVDRFSVRPTSFFETNCHWRSRRVRNVGGRKVKARVMGEASVGSRGKRGGGKPPEALRF